MNVFAPVFRDYTTSNAGLTPAVEEAVARLLDRITKAEGHKPTKHRAPPTTTAYAPRAGLTRAQRRQINRARYLRAILAGNNTMLQIANATGTRTAAARQMVHQMKEEGLVELTLNKYNCYIIEVTKAGKKLAKDHGGPN